jgi:hypothetical protein
MSRRHDLAGWGDKLYATHARAIADLLGVDEPPSVRIHVERTGPGAAWTSGSDVYLSARWFSAHPDDVGGCLHEFAHAIMRAPVYDSTTAWLIEGIADYVRDVLGHSASWTYAHFEPGMATAGYQTTAHFLGWLEAHTPGAVKALSGHLIAGTYEPTVFESIAGEPLSRCISRYEANQTGA